MPIWIVPLCFRGVIYHPAVGSPVTSGNWWSSTEYSNNNSWNLNNGTTNNNNKNNTNNVLPLFELKPWILLNYPGYLFFIFMGAAHQFVTFDELYAAYVECRKKKRKTRPCIEFEMHEMENLDRLLNDLNNGTYVIGYSICFVVSYPKYREVFAADFRDRIVHHLLIRKFNGLFEEEFIDDTYNCRKGKGTLYGIQRARAYVCEVSRDYARTCWVFKGDIRNFFMSIDKRILAKKLDAFLRTRYNGPDPDFWVGLAVQICMHRPQVKCFRRGDLTLWEKLESSKSLFSLDEYHGMAIGNLTSQIFANFYLSEFDHIMDTYPGVRYCRYVDDFVLISEDKVAILNLVYIARKYLRNELGLVLHSKKWMLQPYEKGFPFLGMIIKGDRLYTIRRTIGKMKSVLINTRDTDDRYIQRVNSYFGYLSHTSSYDIRRHLWEVYIPESRKEDMYAEKHLCRIVLKNRRKRELRDKVLDIV